MNVSNTTPNHVDNDIQIPILSFTIPTNVPIIRHMPIQNPFCSFSFFIMLVSYSLNIFATQIYCY